MQTREALAFHVFHPKQEDPYGLTNRSLEKCIQEIVSHSSQFDLWMRFFGTPDVAVIAGRMTGRIQDAYEQPRDIVVVAFENRRPVAYADLVRFPEQAASAEFSMLVRSERQRQGIGQALIRETIQAARKEGVNHVEAYVHPENLNMQRALHKWSQAEELSDVTFRKTFQQGEMVYTLIW